jgi:hypothetical protein
MQRLGDELLTGTRFAQDQHSAFIRCESRDRGRHHLQRGRITDEAGYLR